jgi:hypothetical protein
MTAFLAAVGVTVVGAFFTVCWHILARNEKPEFEDLAIGFDLLVATAVLEFGFFPGSQGLALSFRWAGVVALFIMLTGMAVLTKFCGYQPSYTYANLENPGLPDLSVARMTSKAVWLTNIAGCVVLCTFWWLNVNIELVISVWRDVFR